MEITENEIKALSRYIADYLTEENIPDVDSFLVSDAIAAFIGGAVETE